MRSVILASPTYRGYTYQWVRGLVSLEWPDPVMSARLDALDVALLPAIAQGYGAARNMGTIFASACAQGADFVFTIEWDHDWDARHVAQAMEAEAYLAGVHGCPVAVGAMYPSSGQPTRHVFKPLDADEITRRSLEDRVLACEDLREAPEAPLRYEEAAVLPAGFTLWPVAPFLGVDIEERCGLTREDYWDAQASMLCRAAGVRLFYDLSLDVGHVPAVGISSLDLVKLSMGGSRG